MDIYVLQGSVVT